MPRAGHCKLLCAIISSQLFLLIDCEFTVHKTGPCLEQITAECQGKHKKKNKDKDKDKGKVSG